MSRPSFPFAAVVGQEQLKLALLLNAVDPSVGGVLMRGEKGSGKSTLARSLARLLGSRAPFVELPVGSSVERLVGTLEVAGADQEVRFEPGVLAAVHGGVLYVDQINRLPDHLVDVLLDVAGSGINQLEGRGIVHSHPSRFVLIGSMNPDDGELRPQLFDRIGLSVDVRAPTDPAERAEVVTRRMAFDADQARFLASWSAADEELAMKLGDARPASLPPELVRMVANLCVRMGAEGLRGDLTVCRAAAALAGWERRRVAGVDDVRRVAPLALAHRCRRSPFEAPGIDQDELDRAVREGAASVPPPVEPPAPPPAKPKRAMEPSAAAAPAPVEPAVPVLSSKPRPAARGQAAASLFVLAVDASSSAGAERRMEAAKGAVVGLLSDAYQRHHLIALVTFRGFAAEVILRPTSSVEVARARLTRLPTGGKTPLAEGIAAALRIATLPGRAQTHRPLLVLVSDGRATHANDGSDPLAAAMGAAGLVRAKGVAAVVLDPGNGTNRHAAPRQLVEAMGGRYELLAEVSARELEQAVRQAATVLDGSP